MDGRGQRSAPLARKEAREIIRKIRREAKLLRSVVPETQQHNAAASFLGALQLNLSQPEIQLSPLRRTNAEVSPAPGILDALHVFVGEIKKALSRALIANLACKPSALLHLCKHLKL